MTDVIEDDNSKEEGTNTPVPNEQKPVVEAPQPSAAKNGEPIPTPTGAISDDIPEYGSGDDEASNPEDAPTDDDEPEEVYAGEFNRLKQVSIDAPITEPVSDELLANFAKNGKVILTNMNADETFKLDEIIRLRVFMAQRERYEKIDAGLPASNWIQVDLEGFGIVYLTADEQKAMALLNEMKRQVALMPIDVILEEDDKATNRPMVDGNPIMMGLMAPAKGGTSLNSMRDQLGLSRRVGFPLWASGMHVKLNGPGAIDQLGLDAVLGQDKVREAMESLGYSLAAPAVYLNREVVDFAIKHMISTTAGTTDPQTLKEMISLLDFDQIVTSLAFSMHSKGFPVTRRCINSAIKCDGEINDKLNINRMIIVLDSRLNEHQKRFMAKRNGNQDPKSILNYQSMMRENVSRYVDLGEGVRLKLRVPSIAQYEAISTAWLDNMTNESRSLISSNAREEDRKNYLLRAQRVSTVMAYAHWVEAIVGQGDELESEPVVVKTRNLPATATQEEIYETNLEIDDFLRDFANSEELTETFRKALEKFIAAMTVTTVCLEKVKCPKCGNFTEVEDTGPSSHPALVTINPVEFFFTLHRRKIASL